MENLEDLLVQVLSALEHQATVAIEMGGQVWHTHQVDTMTRLAHPYTRWVL